MGPSTDHHEGRGIRWTLTAITAVTGLAVIAVAAWFVVGHRSPGEPGRPEDAPAFRFTIGRVTAAGVEPTEAGAALRRAAERLRPTLDEMYSAGFVDPEKWEGGRFSEVLASFSGEAASRARSDLGELTLGEAADQVTTVDVNRGRLNVQFLLGPNGRPFAAVAGSTFRATGTLRDGRALALEHSGRYLMRPEDQGWVIVGYRVEGQLEPGPASPGREGPEEPRAEDGAES